MNDVIYLEGGRPIWDSKDMICFDHIKSAERKEEGIQLSSLN